MNYIYSATQNAIFPLSIQHAYIDAGTWPDDAVEITDSMVREFSTDRRAEGKLRVAGAGGLPAWGDIPAPTPEQRIAGIEQYRQSLLNYADKVTDDWRTELALGEISDADKTKLSAWMAYKREVKAVDANVAIASDFTWPALPAI